MESSLHKQLLDIGIAHAKGILPLNHEKLLYCDTEDSVRPPKIEKGFIPDAYYRFECLQIIVEAKTSIDFLSRHSKQQYQAYIDESKRFSGQTVLIFVVPWDAYPSAKNLFRRLRKVNDYQGSIVIINEMNMKCEV